MMLEKIVDDLDQIKSRRREINRLLSALDLIDSNVSVYEPDEVYSPELPQLVDVGYAPSEAAMTTSSRRTHKSAWIDPYRECTFRPQISAKSRKLAARAKVQARSPKTVPVVEPEKQPQQPNPVTEAIVAKIKQMYGSIDNYHKQRRSAALSYKDLPSRTEQEMQECTFKPKIDPKVPTCVLKEPSNPVEGFEAFLRRQEKAREIKVATITASDRKPGCGQVYTGQPTKVKPFAFHHIPSRE